MILPFTQLEWIQISLIVISCQLALALLLLWAILDRLRK